MYGDSSEVKCFKARKFAWNQYHPISQYVSLQFSRSKVWFWAVIELQEVRTLPGHDGHVQLWLSYRHSGRRTMTFHPQQEAYTKNDQLILYQLYTSFSSFSLGMILIKKNWLFAPSLLSAKKTIFERSSYPRSKHIKLGTSTLWHASHVVWWYHPYCNSAYCKL